MGTVWEVNLLSSVSRDAIWPCVRAFMKIDRSIPVFSSSMSFVKEAYGGSV